MKRALVVGIDDYPGYPLHACVGDAMAVAQLLEKNGDGSPNFSVRPITSDKDKVTGANLTEAISELFKGDADTVLLYFAGHGIIDQEMNVGHIVSQDGRKGAWGVSLSDILGLANKAYPRIKSSVIILDSCHSGFAGEVPALNSTASIIGSGVTILTAEIVNGTGDLNPTQKAAAQSLRNTHPSAGAREVLIRLYIAPIESRRRRFRTPSSSTLAMRLGSSGLETPVTSIPRPSGSRFHAYRSR